MYLISTHRSHLYQYAYYPAGKKNTQLLTSLHHETNETMSEHGEWLEHYYGNTLEDQDDDELPDSSSVDDEKQKERDILLWENFMDRLESDKEHYPILDERGNMMEIDSLPKQATIPAVVDKRKQKKISDYYY